MKREKIVPSIFDALSVQEDGRMQPTTKHMATSLHTITTAMAVQQQQHQHYNINNQIKHYTKCKRNA